MADTRLYKVAITPCGKYVHGTEYDRLCLVLNATEDGGDGCSYISLQKNKNVKPGTDDTVWALSLERGEQGEQGPSGAGFSGVEITVNDTTGTPFGTAVIENDTLYLSFSGMKGEPGQQGPQGETGAAGAKGDKGATPDFSIGTVSTVAPGTPASASMTGTPEAPVLNLTIPQGMQGNTGSSVEFPYELVNNLTTNDATKGLSAAQGYVLDGKVSQLEAKVDENSLALLGNYVEATAFESGQGWVNKNNGVLNTSEPYSYLYKKISFDPKYDYIVKYAKMSGGGSGMLNFYDENNTFLGYAYAPSPITTYTDVRVEAPENTSYIIFVSDGEEGTMIYSKFFTPEDYASAESVEKIEEIIESNFSTPPISASGQGWVNKSNGALITNEPFNYLYKKVSFDSRFDYIVKSATISGSSAAMLNFYDGNDAYLGYAYNPGTSTSYENVKVVAPAGTAYIIFVSEYVEGIVVYSKFVNADLETLEQDVEAIKDENEVNSKAIRANYTDAPVFESGHGWVNKSNGNLETATPFGYLYKKIRYEAEYDYILKSATISGGGAGVLNYYDDSDVFLGYEYAPTASTSYTNVSFTPPSGTSYIILVSEDVEGEMIYSKFSAEQGPKSYWAGKKIVWFGTSIPATPYSGGQAYPQIVGTALGAMVVNRAISGSFARKKFNPNDLPNMHGLDVRWDMLSMVTSFADIQDLQTNWSQYKACFDNPPDTLDDYVHTYQVCSYQTVLDPFIEDADLFVFDHGRNDLPDMVNENDMFDKFTFVGAMNWLIKHIYEAKPRARICIISHYENQLYPTIVEAQEIVANYWSIPMFRLDKMLGWSNRQITTNHKWDGNVYVESETANTMSVQHAWLKDDLHPYLDSTGEATLLIANAISAWMKTVV